MMPACPWVSIYYILPQDLVNRSFHLFQTILLKFLKELKKKGMEIIVIEH